MSGGSFDYAYSKVDEDDIFSTMHNVRDIENYLRSIGKHDAADETLIFIKEVETHQRRLRIIGRRIAGLLKSAEWVASGDSTTDYIDNAYLALMGMDKEQSK